MWFFTKLSNENCEDESGLTFNLLQQRIFLHPSYRRSHRGHHKATYWREHTVHYYIWNMSGACSVRPLNAQKKIDKCLFGADRLHDSETCLTTQRAFLIRSVWAVRNSIANVSLVDARTIWARMFRWIAAVKYCEMKHFVDVRIRVLLLPKCLLTKIENG